MPDVTLPQVKRPAGLQPTDIEWTDFTFNPLRAIDHNTSKVGWHCVPVAPGCANCYAAAINRRFGTGLDYAAQNTARVSVVLDEQRIEAALKWKPRKGFRSRNGSTRPMAFVCDMTDLFGEWVPLPYIVTVYAVAALRPDIDWQVLTKRPERAAEMAEPYVEAAVWARAEELRYMHGMKPQAEPWPLPNLWLGCSVSDQRTADAAIPHLLRCPAAVRGVSYEPAIGGVDFRRINACDGAWWDVLDCTYTTWGVGGGIKRKGIGRLDWLIVGGESGHGARPFDVEWARSAIRQCREAGVPVFVKQLGKEPREYAEIAGALAYLKLRDPKGGDMAEWPEDLRVREWPTTKGTTC